MPLDLVFSKPPSGSLIPKILNSFLPTCWKIRQNVAQEKGTVSQEAAGSNRGKEKNGCNRAISLCTPGEQDRLCWPAVITVNSRCYSDSPKAGDQNETSRHSLPWPGPGAQPHANAGIWTPRPR